MRGLTSNQRGQLHEESKTIIADLDKMDALREKINKSYKKLKADLNIDVSDLRAVVNEKRADNDAHLKSESNKEILREALDMPTLFDFMETLDDPEKAKQKSAGDAAKKHGAKAA